MILIIAGKVLTNTVDERVHWAWANFFYINNYIPIDRQFLGYSWYVAAEEHFYLLLPLLLLAVPRRWLIHSLLGLFLVAVLVRYVVLATAHPAIEFVVTPALDDAGFHRWYDGMHNKTHMRFGIPLCGVIGAYVFKRTRFVPYLSERPGLSLAVFAAALAPVLWIYGQLDYVNYHAWSTPWFLTLENYGGAVCVTVLVLLLLSPQGIGAWCGRALSLRWFYPLAQLSYAIYLIHPLVLFVGLGARYPKPPETYDVADLARLWPGNLAASIGIALVFHLLVEKPVARMRQH
jgi:peptidoglycan/LPS O-acetylase OafA/YrhL